MKKMEVEVFSDAVNNAVTRFPGRKFPGVLIQGDTLHGFLDMALEICELATKSNAFDIQELSTELKELLESHVSGYEDALRTHNMELPYPV